MPTAALHRLCIGQCCAAPALLSRLLRLGFSTPVYVLRAGVLGTLCGIPQHTPTRTWHIISNLLHQTVSITSRAQIWQAKVREDLLEAAFLTRSPLPWML